MHTLRPPATAWWLLPHLAYRKSIYGDGPFPTSTTLEVQKLFAPGLMIEIEVTAVVG